MNASTQRTSLIVGSISIPVLIAVGIFFFIAGNKPADSTIATEPTAVPTIRVAVTSTPVAVVTAVATATPATTAAPTATAAGVATATPTPTATAQSSTYTDGTYTANTSYSVPRETNTLAVTLTVKNDIITAASATHTGFGESQGYHSSFDSSLKGTVVGKSLASFTASRIGSASLTSAAFNKALTSIKTQAGA
jgi:hypothetical protein